MGEAYEISEQQDRRQQMASMLQQHSWASLMSRHPFPSHRLPLAVRSLCLSSPPSPSCSFHRRCNPQLSHLHISNSALPLPITCTPFTNLTPSLNLRAACAFTHHFSIFTAICSHTEDTSILLSCCPACCNFNISQLLCCYSHRWPTHFGCGLVVRGRVCKNGS